MNIIIWNYFYYRILEYRKHIITDHYDLNKLQQCICIFNNIYKCPFTYYLKSIYYVKYIWHVIYILNESYNYKNVYNFICNKIWTIVICINVWSFAIWKSLFLTGGHIINLSILCVYISFEMMFAITARIFHCYVAHKIEIKIR